MILYLIRNIVNNKCYVGQTTEKYEGQRKRQHFHRLRKGTHQNPYLQAAYNKYGANNFQFELIEVVDSLFRLNELEKTWIEFYRTKGRSYNLRLGGDNSLMPEETKARMKIAQNKPELLEIRSKTHKGRVKSQEHLERIRVSNIKTKSRPVTKFDLQGNILKEFDTIPEAFCDWGKSKSGFEAHIYKGAKSKTFYYRFKV